MPTPSKLFFLLGASSNVDFWRPVASQLANAGEPVFFGWPGVTPLLP